MRSRLDRALDDCLARLSTGEATLEECLARYPEHLPELRRLLAAAERVEQGRLARPSAVFKARARTELTAYAQAHPRYPVQTGSRWPGLYDSLGRLFNFASGLAAITLLVVMTGTVLAQVARPGDALYGWRVASERVWRSLHPNPFMADLALARRHAEDLTLVAGNEQAEPVARRDYELLLAALTYYRGPEEQKLLSENLSEQKAELTSARVNVPELDKLLRVVSVQETYLDLEHSLVSVEEGRLIYNLTITNQGPAGPAGAVVLNTLSPVERLVSTGDAACTVVGGRQLNCTIDNLAVNASRTLTLTTAIDRCYEGTINNTAVVTGTRSILNINLDNQVETRERITRPFPGSARVVYVQSNGRSHNLGTVTAGGDLLELALPLHAAAPAWSPDGMQLAFFGQDGISELGGVYSQGNGVWLMDIINDQAQNPRLLIDRDHVRNITWSPNGLWLAFEVGPPDLPHEIIVIDARDGQEISRFPGEQPAWSPNSQKLVIKSCAPGCGLWQVNRDGSNGVQVTFQDTDSYPAWSPTDEYLAFSSQREGNWEIYLLRWMDGQVLRLTERAATDTTPVFGPCGTQVYLRTDAFGSWWITLMKLDGSDERKVREGVGPSDDWGQARPAVY